MGNPSGESSHWDKSPLSQQPRPVLASSPFASPRYARRQSLYPSPSTSYSTSALCSAGPGLHQGHQQGPSIAINKGGGDENNDHHHRFGYQGMNSDDREGNEGDVCQSYSSRRSSLTSTSQQGLNKHSGSNAHPHKWWKPFSLAPSSVSARTAVRRNSNSTSSVKLVPPRITKTQYPENV